MRSSHLLRAGAGPFRASNPRRQADRRRWAIVAAMLALAIGSGVLGSLSERGGHVKTGPFSYLTE